jgi:hypothetical protein
VLLAIIIEPFQDPGRARVAAIRGRAPNIGVQAPGTAIDVEAEALTVDAVVRHTADHSLAEAGFDPFAVLRAHPAVTEKLPLDLS